jgi:hypothetical protein
LGGGGRLGFGRVEGTAFLGSLLNLLDGNLEEISGGSKMEAVSDQLRNLSNFLKLHYEEQDWGIINADGNRLEEFVAVYDSRPFSVEIRYQMFELILASANDALGKKRQEANGMRVIQDFVRRHGQDFPEQVSYWAGLKNSDEFPVGEALRKIA